MAQTAAATVHSCPSNNHLPHRRQILGWVQAFGFMALAILFIWYGLSIPMEAQAGPSMAWIGAACQELLVNGDLESATSGNWRFGSTAAPGVIVGDLVHGGGGAIRLGIPIGTANKLTHSTAYQIVTVPSTTAQLTLTYWERPGNSGDSNDRREILVLNSNFNVMAQIAVTTGSGTDAWHQRTFDLLDSLPSLAGQTVILYWNVYNNGSGATLVTYLDDLSLQACDNTATPTATTTVPAATLTPTPTVVSTPDPVRVRVGTVTASEGATAVTVPLDVIVLTDRFNVGVLSASVDYDTTLLAATGCSQEEPIDLLLCNVTRPGVVQLAGVSALGIRGEMTVANLTFNVLQNTDQATPLLVKVKLVGDGSGTAVGATPLNGSIDLNCAPNTEPCTRGNNIYLPLVQR